MGCGRPQRSQSWLADKPRRGSVRAERACECESLSGRTSEQERKYDQSFIYMMVWGYCPKRTMKVLVQAVWRGVKFILWKKHKESGVTPEKVKIVDKECFFFHFLSRMGTLSTSYDCIQAKSHMWGHLISDSIFHTKFQCNFAPRDPGRREIRL